jgi:plastocyanin
LPPVQIKQGTDLEFVNLDAAAVTNGHQIISYQRKRGKPVFRSPRVEGPATAVIITSHLKPGVYPFFCATHFGMEAALEIVP